MRLDLTEDQQQVGDLCREFAEKELKPNARKWDETHHYPAEAVKKLGEMGLMGVAVPAERAGRRTAPSS